MDAEEIKQSIRNKLENNCGCELSDATPQQLYQAVAHTVRDEVMRRRTASRGVRKAERKKKVYYLCAEFLTGRALHANIVNLVNEANYKQALRELNIDSEAIFELEPEPGLGNGGLGRLAACFLDALTTMNLPAMGCTIRYEFGLFRQKLIDGYQAEVPDNWLKSGNIWEIPRPDQMVEVHFGGYLQEYTENGRLKYRHLDYKTVEAVPYDIPIVGYDTSLVNMLRVWSARSKKRIDMASFNSGQYIKAMEERELAEVISKVLYPNDGNYEGKELRLKQQYFFSSASVQYAVNDFIKVYGYDWKIFPDKVAIHINDTHPAIAIPELMRIFVDEYELPWDTAEDLCRRTFAYTNHTVMQEALERWPEDMLRVQLPRIHMILCEMNRRLCEKLWAKFPGQWDRIAQMSILAYGQAHMANLAVSSTHAVNGVSAIHTDILRRQTFRDYAALEPSKFLSITNGITHRRWLMQANPGLSALIDEAIGGLWRKSPERLEDLLPFREDAAFRDKFDAVKRQNKERLSRHVLSHQCALIDPGTIFDAQAKRLHEYKRQLINALGILMMYNQIDANPDAQFAPRTFLFGAKASPGYYRAKLIIKLINAIGELVKRHPRASKLINVVFLENYCVSLAELLMPATDISEQLSTAGKEASGTGNMKFMMNGAVTVGTMDGANCEIFDAVGKDNIYIFGLNAEEVEQSYSKYRASEIYETNPAVRHALEQLINGQLSPDNPVLFQELYHALLFGDGCGMADPYFVLKDLPAFLSTQRRVSEDYLNREKWLKMAITNTAKSGAFAADRTIAEYNEKIWRLEPLEL